MSKKENRKIFGTIPGAVILVLKGLSVSGLYTKRREVTKYDRKANTSGKNVRRRP